MEEFEFKDTFVAPWGLPNEEIPIHYIWEGKVDRLVLKFDSAFEVLQIFNTEASKEKYMSVSNGARILSISSDDLISDGYFSAILTVPEHGNEPLVGHVVEAQLSKRNVSKSTKNVTFTTRPMIRVQNIPSQIRLEDDQMITTYDGGEERVVESSYPGSVEVNMEQIGFSIAQVETVARGQGRLLSKEESVYQDLAEAVLEATADGEADLLEIPEEARENVGVEIPDETVEETVEEFRGWLSDDDSLMETYSTEEIDQLTQFMEAEGTEFDMSEIYKHFEFLLMNSILDVVDRHPVSNVQMQSPQTTVEIDSRLESLNVQFELSDKVGNHYESEVIEIEIEDNRDEGGIAELEISTNWDEVQIDPSKLDELRQAIDLES